MVIRQFRVFVRSNESLEDWAETLIGKVFCPLVDEFSDNLEWFWFSRYASVNGDIDDCDFNQIPEDFLLHQQDSKKYHRSMRFRFSIPNDKQVVFEKRAHVIIQNEGYYISDIRDYDHVKDLAQDRFLGNENRRPQNRGQRAILVAYLFCAIARLVIDALVGPDGKGRFRMERNDVHSENPKDSSFQSLHHLFCNITNVPTDVHVHRQKGKSILGFGTYRHLPHPSPPGGWDEFIGGFPIKY